MKISVVFSVLITPLFAILGTTVYQLRQEGAQDTLNQYSQNTMDLVTEQLHTFIQGIEEDIGHYGTNSLVQEALQSGLTPENEDAILKEFLHFKKNHPDILDLYIGTKDKRTLSANLAGGGALPEGYDPTSRPWYKNAEADTKSVHWGRPYMRLQQVN
ncbi:cache domain-containing protein [Bacillus cytotoxicus]